MPKHAGRIKTFVAVFRFHFCLFFFFPLALEIEFNGVFPATGTNPLSQTSCFFYLDDRITFSIGKVLSLSSSAIDHFAAEPTIVLPAKMILKLLPTGSSLIE